MATRVNIPTLHKARALFNLFSTAAVQVPKTDLCRALLVFEPLIQQELAMLTRLSALPKHDERRALLPMSLGEANRHFGAFHEAALNVAGDRISTLEADGALIERMAQFPNKPGKMKSALFELLDGSPDARSVEEIWIQRVFSVERLTNLAVQISPDDAARVSRQTFSRTIVFEPQFRQAGISILSYFGEILHSKYPSIDVRVRIEQSGRTVTLHVETPNGQVETFERELTQYGLAVTGRISIDDYLPDRLAALRLEQKLQLAEMEARHTKELLASERNAHAQQITTLRDQIEYIRSALDKSMNEAAQAATSIRSMAVGSNELARAILERLASIVESQAENKIELLSRELQAASRSQPTVIDHINELLIKGSIQGAAGNYFYAALQTLQRLL